MKYHSEFDPKDWLTSHTLTVANKKSLTNHYGLSSPGAVASCFKVRRKLAKLGAPFPVGIPVDLCVWNWGDGDRRTTKIGGIPFWPKRCRWPRVCDLFPHAKDNDPLTYIGQFCFADSHDLLPDLPGDILVLLSCWKNFGNSVGIWFRLDDLPLLRPCRIPKTDWAITPLHASLYRTTEYEFEEAFWEWLNERNFPMGGAHYQHATSTKLGGLCPDRGGEYTRENRVSEEANATWLRDHDERLQRRYLATLFTPEGSYQKWPYLGLPDGKTISSVEREELMMIADCGGMSIYRDGNSLDVNVSSG